MTKNELYDDLYSELTKVDTILCNEIGKYWSSDPDDEYADICNKICLAQDHVAKAKGLLGKVHTYE